MNENTLLNNFENKYRFLYEYLVNGVPLYTCLRDDVLFRLQGGNQQQPDNTEKGRVYPRRILDGIVKLRRLKNAKTVVFTSAVYRRDHGRNLAAEYLMERYPDAAVFEWPARNDVFDSAYFTDLLRDRYCPLDAYIVWYKIKCILNRKDLAAKEKEYRKKLVKLFAAAEAPSDENEKVAVEYVLRRLPEACVVTEFSQKIFQSLFRRYNSIEYAIDYWGSGKENIFPVLHGGPEKIELQHGLIFRSHPGYIYPLFVGNIDSDFFKRKLLVYGEATKQILIENSVFTDAQIEVIGNPRISAYKIAFRMSDPEKKYILFTSQPFEQDGKGNNYYSTVIPILREMQMFLSGDQNFGGYQLVIKLHPRENESASAIYRNALKNIEIFDSSTNLYELINKSWLHMTANSTTLFEAAEFQVPTVMISYAEYTDRKVYGFNVKTINNEKDVPDVLREVANEYEPYTNYLKEQTKKYM